MKAKLTRFIRRLLYRHFGLIHETHITPALEEMEELAEYVDRSGHLANGYHAGKRVKRTLRRIYTNLKLAMKTGGQG